MTLPGMPIRHDDPGVFICGPADIAPWEQARPRPATPPAPRRPGPAWLVLALCPHCNVQTGYHCLEHNERNWWLENFRPRR